MFLKYPKTLGIDCFTNHYNPHHPWMVYLPTFTIQNQQKMSVNIPFRWIRNGNFFEKHIPIAFQLPPFPKDTWVALKALSWTPGARTRDDDFQWLGLNLRFKEEVCEKGWEIPTKKTGDFSWGYNLGKWTWNIKRLEVWFRWFSIFWIFDPTITLRETNIASENGWLELEWYFPLGSSIWGDMLVSGRVVTWTYMNWL